MNRGTWKARERKIARDFGAQRTPLSGGASGHTRSDTLHEELFIEIKGRASHAAMRLFDKTAILAKAEGKIPVVALWEPNRNGYLVLCRPEDLMEVTTNYLGGKMKWNYPAGVSDSDFDDHELRRLHRRYVEDCRADEVPPLTYERWLEEMDEEESDD